MAAQSRCALGILTLCLGLSQDLGTGLPPAAKVFRDINVSFPGESAPLKVIFYNLMDRSAGVVILSPTGQRITEATLDVPHGLDNGAGVYDLSDDSSKELVLIGRVGAKSSEARIYSYKQRALHEIFHWSGYSSKIVRLHDRPVIAATATEYGTLPDLYCWRDNGFKESNHLFPEYYVDIIESEKGLLNGADVLPAYKFAQACTLGAKALLYGKSYAEAHRLCQKALQVIDSGARVAANATNALPEQLYVERDQASKEIGKTLERIEAAQKQGLSQMPE